MSQSGPSPRKSKRRRGILLGAVALLLLVIAAAILFRQELATRAAVAYLESQGVTVQNVTVSRLTPGAIELRDLVLGEGGELSVAQIRITPHFVGLEATLQTVQIDGLRLHLDLTGEAPLLGSLQPALNRLTAGSDTPDADPAAEAAPGEPLAIPTIVLRDAQVIFATPSGPMTAELGGTLAPDDAGGHTAEAALHLDSALGGLQADLVGRRSAAGAMTLTAQVEDGRLAWQGFAVNAFAGRLSLEQAPEGAPRIAADFTLDDLGYTPAAGAPLHLASGRLTAEGDLAAAALTLQLEGDAEYLSLEATAQRSPAGGREDLALSVEGEVRTAGGLAQFLALPGPPVTAGTLVLQGEGSASLPAEGDLQDWRAGVAMLPHSRLSLSGDAILGEVVLADGTTGVSAHLPLIVEAAEDRATVTLSDDAAVRVERPSRDSLRDLGVPEDLLPLLVSGLNLTLAAGGDLPFRLAVTPIWPPQDAEITAAAQAASDQGLRLAVETEGSASLGQALALTGFTGSLNARAEVERLSLGGREARGMTLALPLAAAWDSDGLRLSLARPGTLRIARFGATTPLQLQAPLAFEIEALALTAAPDAAGYSYGLSAREDGADFAVTAAGTEPIAVAAGALTLVLDGRFDPQGGHAATIAMRLGGLGLPGYGFTAAAAELDVTLDRELRPAQSRFALGPFQLAGEAPLTAPLTLAGNLSRAGAGYDVTAELAASAGPVLADFSARYGDDGRASLEAVSRLLSFAPDGLQPATISPLLADLENVSGSLTAAARLAWPRDPARESGRVTLSNLSFNGQGAEVAGLDLDITLESLQPLASAPSQRLRIRSLDAGVPIEDIELLFSLDEAPGPRLSVEDGGFDLGGGRWRIEPTALSPGAARNRIVLATDGLDLATFFDLIAVDGLSGIGKLQGNLPIVFAGEDILVEEGRFEALGPGRLSIRIQALRSALAGGGETVEMAIKALEDFHYEELSLTIAKAADNEATLGLSTLGRNPEVLDGQLFRFNINLESNLTSVLEALRQGYSLSDDALRRAWRLHE
ncbi:MAG: YdbH domain-containing protein [Kiloniellaceae bacterium]